MTRYARNLLAAAREGEADRGRSGPGLRHVELESGRGGGTDLLHVPFTDRIFGPTPDEATRAVRDLLAREAPRVWVLNLHDVPQPDEGADRYARRAAAYARLVAQADVVVTNSEHEARGVQDLPGCHGAPVHVIPLPLEPVTARRTPSEPTHQGRQSVAQQSSTIGLLGFVHPGKGYERVIDAAPAGTCVRAIGQVAEGHHDYARALTERARHCGVDVQVTGYVPEDALAAELDAVDVPVCPHLHVSASGSLNTWIAHGRIPLVVDGPYMREVARRWPGTLEVASQQDFRTALLDTLGHPSRTRAVRPPPSWGWSQVAAAYSALWTEALS
ncbi:glycosyltransferase family 4 protein [Kocuria sp. JC486]|uniref:glycosyltransferase family 4 protein n=1 Tax=Kocuria sp. JC486 TaxID=1970736 RepID=UPI001422729F|nr:glycosyltransferase family 4 protein [Kocuria sp. JC486]NHU85425.1 glycosyltransferase family 4 protein [Kocuria sp. JC486]